MPSLTCRGTAPAPGHTPDPPGLLVTPEKGGVTSPTLPEPRGEPPQADRRLSSGVRKWGTSPSHRPLLPTSFP